MGYHSLSSDPDLARRDSGTGGETVMAWMTDPDGRCAFVTRSWYDRTGHPERTGLGDGWLDALHPDDRGRVADLYRAAFDERESFQFRYRLRHRDDGYHWALHAAAPHIDSSRGFLGYVGSITDMVRHAESEERPAVRAGAPDLQALQHTGGYHQAEASRRLTEARYRDLIQALPAAFYTCDLAGRITLCNEAAVALWGQEPEIGQDLWCWSWKIYRPDGTPLALEDCPMAITLREGRPVRGVEILIERPDGSRRYVLPNPEPMRDAEGRLVGAVNVLMDITERKETEQSLARLAAIVTHSDDAIISKTLQGVVTSWNQGAERLFGYRAEEMIGQPVTKLIPESRDDEEPGILRRLARGETIDHYETVRRRKDGTLLDISLTVSPIADSQGRIIGASKIARDITERKKAEAALKAANDALNEQRAALAEINKELESFSYSVSHDLRAPLRTIAAFSRIVIEEHADALPAEAQRCLAIVRKAADQAGELIDDLLELSRLGRQGMDVRIVPMRALAREVADELRFPPDGRRVDLLAADLPDCRGDSRLLRLVWQNLLSNAFKYTKYREPATVEIGWRAGGLDGHSVTYYVKDNGVGFDMKYTNKLFGVFQRLHRKEEFDGTGVGLAIVQRIVHRHGGRVWAEGALDAGATFYFSLPAMETR